MTKDEILNGMSEEEFYSLYPTKESWEQAQAQMAYGGSPYNPGIPFGAGIMMSHGGTPYYGGPLYPAAEGANVFTEKKMSPQEWEQYNIKRGYKPMLQNVGQQSSTNPLASKQYKSFYNPAMGAPTLDPGSSQYKYAPGQLQDYGYKEPTKQIASQKTGYIPFGQGTAGPKGFYKAGDPSGQKYEFRVGQGYTPIQEPMVAGNASSTSSGTMAYGGGIGSYCWGGLPGGPNEMPTMNYGGYMQKGGPKITVNPKNTTGLTTSTYQEIPLGPDDLQRQVYFPEKAGHFLNVTLPGLILSGGARLGEKAGLTANPELFPDYTQTMHDTTMTGLSPAQQQIELFLNKKRGGQLSKEYIEKARQKPGGSNVGKKTFASGAPRTGPYAGPSGGAPKGSYPIPDIKHARSALALAHNAPNPSGIKAAVYKKYPELKKQVGGSMTPDLQGQYPIFGQGGYDYGGPSPFNYGQFPGMGYGGAGYKKGGDTTSQGGNQSFLDERNSNYLNYIKNNVLKNMHEEESEKVQNAFMQMENSYMQMGGNSFNQINPQNAALQNMYGQQLQQSENQFAQDRSNFRDATENLLGSIYGIPTAQEGKSTTGDLMHKFAEEFGPRSRKTGLPMFPANIGTHYQLNKEDAAKLAGLPKDFKMQGFKITPEWGWGARTAMNIGNLFRSKKHDKTVPGFAPKKIHYEFTGKNVYNENQPRVLSDSELYGPAPTGTTQAPYPYLPASIRPGYNASGMLTNPIPGQTGFVNTSDQFNFLEYGGDYMGEFYAGGMPMYQGSIMGSQTGNPIELEDPTTKVNISGTSTPYNFQGPPAIDYKKQAGLDQDLVKIDEPEDEQIKVEGDLRKKHSGIGEAIGQYAIPAINMASSAFEQRDYRKAKKKLQESMLADNTFLATPMNAKNRGDYDPNTGMFRPDQKVPVQFPGYAQWGGFNTMAMGGNYAEGDELDLSPEEIEELRQQGYEFEYLD